MIPVMLMISIENSVSLNLLFISERLKYVLKFDNLYLQKMDSNGSPVLKKKLYKTMKQKDIYFQGGKSHSGFPGQNSRV